MNACALISTPAGKRASKSRPARLLPRAPVSPTPILTRLHSKRVGIDKALFQIEQAVKRARSGDHQGTDDEKVLDHLRNLLGSGSNAEISPSYGSHDRYDDEAANEASSSDDDEAEHSRRSISAFVQRTEENLAIDDAENPLQLLARASYFQPSNESRHRSSPQEPTRRAAPVDNDPDPSGLNDYFTSGRVDLDVGEDIDPVSLGLVTEEEAESLFSL